MLRALPALMLCVMLGPVAAGLIGTILPAFGYFPAAGLTEFSFAPFDDLFSWPGLAKATQLSLTTGLMATAISVSIVALFMAGWGGTRAFQMLERALSPLLSIPHAAAAFGLAFLIAPSGWFFRAISPWGTDFHRPPDLLVINDPWGLALVAGLVLKEVPFLLLMSIAASEQVQQEKTEQITAAFGYGRILGWAYTVFPRIYRQIRLPVYVVLAYSMSVVDMAIILGPTTPPTLSVQIINWMSNPDITQRQIAAAGALFQFALVLGALVFWRGLESILRLLGAHSLLTGERRRADKPFRILGLALGAGSALIMATGLLGLMVWSLAGLWSFPDFIPETLTLRSWQRHGAQASQLFWHTLALAFVVTILACALVVGCLQAEFQFQNHFLRKTTWLIYVPLLIPQAAFLPGLQIFMLLLGADIGFAPVVLAHLVFVLPYVFLSFSDQWRAWDSRYSVIASGLGAGPSRVMWKIRMPMLLRPFLTTMAIGIAVSVGQYLPTLLIGGGRIATLTTEAVALASGGDRRAIAIFGLLQTVAAILPFTLALALPALYARRWRNLND